MSVPQASLKGAWLVGGFLWEHRKRERLQKMTKDMEGDRLWRCNMILRHHPPRRTGYNVPTPRELHTLLRDADGKLDPGELFCPEMDRTQYVPMNWCNMIIFFAKYTASFATVLANRLRPRLRRYFWGTTSHRPTLRYSI